jgi:hypothetical protein
MACNKNFLKVAWDESRHILYRIRKSIKLDRKIYEKFNSTETHEIWEFEGTESESLTIYS